MVLKCAAEVTAWYYDGFPLQISKIRPSDIKN